MAGVRWTVGAMLPRHGSTVVHPASQEHGRVSLLRHKVLDEVNRQHPSIALPIRYHGSSIRAIAE
jgi:hypothetical protein